MKALASMTRSDEYHHQQKTYVFPQVLSPTTIILYMYLDMTGNEALVTFIVEFLIAQISSVTIALIFLEFASRCGALLLTPGL